jgi:hypothetical protein
MCAINRKSLTALGAAARRLRKHKQPSRLVYGVASLPLGAPGALEIIFEVVD